jgi:hypothetical protein
MSPPAPVLALDEAAPPVPPAPPVAAPPVPAPPLALPPEPVPPAPELLAELLAVVELLALLEAWACAPLDV